MKSANRYNTEGRRLVILTGGLLGVFTAKTAVSLIRYRPEQVVAVLDEKHAGQDLEQIVGIGSGIPIVASVEEARRWEPNELLIGVAPVGGALDASWRAHIREALRAGMDVAAGLHIPLSRDKEFAELARQHGNRIFDLREPPEDLPIAGGLARTAKAKRILTVGTDCNVGKMVTAIELQRVLAEKGRDAAFVATGQTGIMIDGNGIAIDRVISDFVAGAAELLVLENAEREVLCIEGQGSIINVAYSGVTLGLLHGCCADGMIMCHHAPRDRSLHFQDFPLPSLPELIDLYEAVTAAVWPGRVIGISLNTVGLSPDEARAEKDRIEDLTGLPTTDPVRFGAEPLAEAVEGMLG